MLYMLPPGSRAWALGLMILISFGYFLKGAPIVLSDSEEEEMIILEPDKTPKKIR